MQLNKRLKVVGALAGVSFSLLLLYILSSPTVPDGIEDFSLQSAFPRFPSNISSSYLAWNASSVLYSVDPPLKALPSVLGYDPEDYDKIFPYIMYPRCPDNSVKDAYSVVKQTVTIHCPNARYIVGPTKTVVFEDLRRKRKESNERRKPKAYTQPFKLQDWEDYVLIRCNSNEKYNAFHMQPTFKETAYQTALQQTQGSRKKPLLVLMVGLDSFPRLHFYRKLKQTLAFLRLLQAQGEWEVFDFYFHNIASMDTRGNLSVLFGGKVFPFDTDKTDRMGEEAIWSILKSKGFMTLMGMDGCPSAFASTVGRVPKIDHLVDGFYCDLIEAGEYLWEKEHYSQRCIGDRMSHQYLFDYAKTFSQMYVDASQWIYAHANAAHELTGQHGQAVDEDLTAFLQHYINHYSSSHELVIYIVGDHGNRYNPFGTENEWMQEYKLPVFFLLARTSFLATIPDLALRANTLRLTSKNDIRESILWLSSWYYDLPFTPRAKYSNLFTQVISTERTCEQIDIAPWNCATNELIEVPPAVYTNTTEGTETSTLIHRVAEYAVSALNKLISSGGRNAESCKKLHLNTIDKVMSVKYEPEKETRTLSMELQVKEEAARFRILVFIMPSVGYNKVDAEPFLLNGNKLSIGLISYRRLDFISKPCDVDLTAKFAKADVCLCS